MTYSKKRSRESRAAVERLYITMRQLIIRGSYKPSGVSGQSLTEALQSLNPEIYGSINDPEKVELDGLLYVAERLPKGIEECRFVQLIAREGFIDAGHDVIIPLKRRRNCYRIDEDRMFVEMSRGRSDIYDILTHLTFLYVEADKIKRKSLDQKGRISDNWKRLEAVVMEEKEEVDEKRALVYLSNVLGRTLGETQNAVEKFEKSEGSNNLYHLIYWMGRVAIDEERHGARKEVTFSAKLRDVIGHHVYGEQWANNIKALLIDQGLFQRDIHIISANLHSFINTIFGFSALEEKNFKDLHELAFYTSQDIKASSKVRQYAREYGMWQLEDNSGTNLSVQIIDMKDVNLDHLKFKSNKELASKPVLLIMDYAFGEQAFECMDELLKPYEHGGKSQNLNVKSISVMGKAGILNGKKGDIMLPVANVYEGTADNYVWENDISIDDFKESEIPVCEGTMVTVLGTSLQNRDVLHHFLTSTWNAVGIEMEGAHYQKAIQSAARIRKSINKDVKVRYAYYASDNPLVTGSTLSSGSLGKEGVKPTYWITLKILEKIMAG